MPNQKERSATPTLKEAPFHPRNVGFTAVAACLALGLILALFGAFQAAETIAGAAMLLAFGSLLYRVIERAIRNKTPKS